jgi:hypothetical protein
MLLLARAAMAWDSYQVIMWSTGAPRDFSLWIDRMREIGVTAEECTGCNSARYGSFGFYVENMVPELGFLNNRQPIYQADFDDYIRTRDKQYLIRKPSLSDPAFWESARASVQLQVRRYMGQQPLLYQLRDELSIGSFASPMDYCFSPHTLRAFRVWLQTLYGSLDALNQEWDTAFASWDDIAPLTTYEIKDRERAALAAGRPENYAPWADHRAFMDITFAQALDRLRGYIREIDPTTPVGIEGTQMPSAWGGYDLWRMSQTVDWVEPYDIAGARAIWRSFLPPGATVLTTVFGNDFPHIRQRLWHLLLQGNRGNLIWDDDTGRAIQKDQDGMAITERGRGLAEVMNEIKSAAPDIFKLKRVDDRIAIHYSQASIRAHWMFDSREDRDTWPRRFSSYEAIFSRIARVRDSFLRVVEDLGLDYNFVSYEQIENDELLRAAYRVLLLPQSVAMSARECERIRAFVEAGGVVIADNMTATMDEHLRRLPRGQLDELFGVQRSAVGWRAKGAAGALGDLLAFEPEIKVTSGTARQKSSAGAPAVIVNNVGDGHAVYLNIDMHDYGKLRLRPPDGAAYRSLFQEMLADAGVRAQVTVVNADDGQPVPCVQVRRYEDGTFAIMRNPEFNAASLKQAGYPDNSAIELPVRVQLQAGDAEVLETDLGPWSPVVVKVEDSQGVRRARRLR